ncbi:tumor necrosis factor receptor superfamily member 25 isoform X2 [Etheostoma spectabile]|uniref:tumor necrosis factor receptor superfamily member 25 isoform X2 n=1 Tax=Etheostoma spectabile TaxID=54343 RepID=UPI0013AF0D9B|nr:tumor necrosis factor receptor superfamily member 25-like isoform X2 [Etheostoma spectabile]
MNFVLVFPLILALLFTGQSYTELTEQNGSSCHKMCPPGYYKVGDCNEQVGKYKCEKCVNGTFTAVKNTRTECLRCAACGNHEVERKPCSFNSNVECDCKAGYYNYNPFIRDCKECSCKHCEEPGNYYKYQETCQPCKSCLHLPDCKRKCTERAFPTSTDLSTSATTSASPVATTTIASNNTSNPIMNPVTPNLNEMPWLFFKVFLVTLLVTFLVFLLRLLLFARKLFRYPNCLCWSAKKELKLPVEQPKFNEQSSHPGSSPNSLTFNISEETPMVTFSQSPATLQHPAHIASLLSDYTAVRQDEQSEHWPAIVLYAIIKEVPLRRWKEFLRLLSVADQQLERVELESGLGLSSIERQYQMLRLWSQRPSASLNDIFSALHYMDLSGCAQLLQESMEKLQRRPELKQGFTACRSYTDHGFNGAMQDT